MVSQLDHNSAERLNQILIKVRSGTETPQERQLLIKIIESIAPEEMELFVKRHGIDSVDALRRYIRDRDNNELIGGLVILGVALLTAYLLSKK